MNRPRLLILGGTGFLSGALCRLAVVRGVETWIVTRGRRPVPEGVTLIRADRDERDEFAGRVAETGLTWDAVVDCIGFTPGHGEQDVAVFRERTRHLLFISSDAVYDPRRRQHPQPVEPAGFVNHGYGHGKLGCENAIRRGAGDSLAWTILRPPHIFGPGAALGCLPPAFRDPLLPRRILAGEPIALAGGGCFLHQPIYVDDLARVILSLVNANAARGRTLNVPGPAITMMRTYYEALAAALGRELRVEEVSIEGCLKSHPQAAAALCHRLYDPAPVVAAGAELPSTTLEAGMQAVAAALRLDFADDASRSALSHWPQQNINVSVTTQPSVSMKNPHHSQSSNRTDEEPCGRSKRLAAVPSMAALPGCRLLLAGASLLLGMAAGDVRAAARPTDAALARMFAVPGLPADAAQIDWGRLPSVGAPPSLVFRGVENESAFTHHPKIVFWDGRFFAKWNDGYVGEDFPGQRVRYATSADAARWSEPVDLTGREDDRRYTTGGFWIRDGELYALAALRDASGSPPTGKQPVLLAYKWDRRTRRFGDRQVIAVDYFPGNIPERAPDGDWLMLGKGGVGSWGPMKAAKGGVKAINDWNIRDLPGAGTLEEAEWYTLPNRHLVAHFRTRGPNPKVLMRSYSTDNGVTWSNPVLTNFPEAGARHHGVRLSNGMYALLVNPNPANRIPFSIALSKDGLVYDRIANVRAEETSARWAGRAKSKGYHYMRGFEHEGKLYTIYSVNKEDIEVTVVPIAQLEALYR